MVMGLVGILLWILFVPQVLAIVFGHVALGQTRRSTQRGRGQAIAGLTLGYLELVGAVVLVIAVALSSPSGVPSALSANSSRYAAASGTSIPGPPKLAGPVVPFDAKTASIDANVYGGLTAANKPSSPGLVTNVALITYGSRVVGHYTDGGEAVQEYATVTIVNIRAHTQYAPANVDGPTPPGTKYGPGSETGGKPSVAEYLNGLPHE